MKNKFGALPLTLYLPIGVESKFEGIIDLINMREIRWDQESQGTELIYSDISDANKEISAEWKEKLLDCISSFSDKITELFLV